MAFRLQKGDYEIIRYLGEYRILLISQLAAVFRRSKQAIRRRCRELKREGLEHFSCYCTVYPQWRK